MTAPLLRLDHLATIVVTGPDAKAFLQGQLSFDLDRLTGERIEITSCNSAQGRVQAVLWLIERSDCLVLLLPTSLVEPTLTRLKKYVLRSKVKLEAGGVRYTVATMDSPLDGPLRAHMERGDHSFIRWPSGRTLVVGPAHDMAAGTERLDSWKLADIAAGLPQVHPQTHEAFVAQMLNLDLLGGIGFEKGCYTGQEIIARTHYRGAIKRRMFRFRANCVPPSAATRIVTSEQHAGDVVDAVQTNDGCELLAVVSLAQLEQPLSLPEGAQLTRLELPYQDRLTVDS